MDRALSVSPPKAGAESETAAQVEGTENAFNPTRSDSPAENDRQAKELVDAIGQLLFQDELVEGIAKVLGRGVKELDAASVLRLEAEEGLAVLSLATADLLLRQGGLQAGQYWGEGDFPTVDGLEGISLDDLAEEVGGQINGVLDELHVNAAQPCG